MDSQVIELLGRNRLVDELLRAGLEVARPERDRGIDLIAYADLEFSFVARPIQMKAASKEHFSIHRKYERFPNIILAYVWNLSQSEKAITYALSYAEALEVAQMLCWTETKSWLKDYGYSTQQPSKRIKELLKRYQMTPKRWWEKVTGSSVRLNLDDNCACAD